MIQSDSDREWLLASAEAEANQFVCVGGLAFSLHRSENLTSPRDHASRLAFAKLISLARRSRRLSLPQLADQAQVDLDELVEIENGQATNPEPRTVHRLAQSLKLPERRLMQLSGLVKVRDVKVDRAAVQFAAQSGSLEKLSSIERQALDEFVKVLAEV